MLTGMLSFGLSFSACKIAECCQCRHMPFLCGRASSTRQDTGQCCGQKSVPSCICAVRTSWPLPNPHLVKRCAFLLPLGAHAAAAAAQQTRPHLKGRVFDILWAAFSIATAPLKACSWFKMVSRGPAYSVAGSQQVSAHLASNCLRVSLVVERPLSPGCIAVC